MYLAIILKQKWKQHTHFCCLCDHTVSPHSLLDIKTLCTEIKEAIYTLSMQSITILYAIYIQTLKFR